MKALGILWNLFVMDVEVLFLFNFLLFTQTGNQSSDLFFWTVSVFTSGNTVSVVKQNVQQQNTNKKTVSKSSRGGRRFGVEDLVAPSDKVSDYNQLLSSKQDKEKRDSAGSLWSCCVFPLVCLFWASVQTWRCNMASEEPLSLWRCGASFKGSKNRFDLIFRWL